MRVALPFLSLALCTQCAKAPVAPTPSQTYQERELAIVQGVAPLLAGQWQLTAVQYSRLANFQYPVGWPRDTIIAQLATLTLQPVRASQSWQQLHPKLAGQLTYAGKTYPVSLALWATPDRVLRQQGPPAYFRLMYNFPDSTHQTEVEEQFLQDVGLVGSLFSVEVTAGQNTMQWQGLDRHLRTITLRK